MAVLGDDDDLAAKKLPAAAPAVPAASIGDRGRAAVIAQYTPEKIARKAEKFAALRPMDCRMARRRNDASPKDPFGAEK